MESIRIAYKSMKLDTVSIQLVSPASGEWAGLIDGTVTSIDCVDVSIQLVSPASGEFVNYSLTSTLKVIIEFPFN